MRTRPSGRQYYKHSASSTLLVPADSTILGLGLLAASCPEVSSFLSPLTSVASLIDTELY